MLIGAVAGVVGSLLNRGVSIYENHQKAAIDKERRSDELKMAELNAARDSVVASYSHDTSLGENASTWVNNIRAMVRPSITAYGLAITTVFFFHASDTDKSILIASVVDLTTMAVTWWFSDRFKK